MKRITIAIGIIFILVLSSCISDDPSNIPENPTIIPTINQYANYSTSKTITAASMFAGPGNISYDLLTTIPPDTLISTLGVFGDFVKIYLPTENTEGFVLKKTLQTIEVTLESLPIDTIPWIEKNYIEENCMGPFTQIMDDGSAIIKDYTKGPGGYQLQGAPIKNGNETQITIDMYTNNDKTTWLGFSDAPFRNYGEWYLGFRTVTIFKELNGFPGYSIEFRDGLKPDAITISLNKVGNSAFNLVFLDASGSKVQIRDLSNNVLYDFDIPGITYDGMFLSLPNGLFPKQIMYINCSSDGPTTTTYAQQKIKTKPLGTEEMIKPDIADLSALAAKAEIEIMVPNEGWRMGDQQYSQIIHQQITMENVEETAAPNFWLDKDVYNFDYLDNLILSIQKDNRKILAGIVYGPAPESVPENIRNGNYSKDQYIEILHDYITTVVCRYKDQVSIWSIANESVGAEVVNVYDFWNDKIGPEYIDLSFKWARECDSDGILLLNDSINDSRRDPETTQYVEAMVRKVKQMKSDGVPIDAIGIQGHFFLPWNSLVPPTKEGLIQTMKEYGELGVAVYFTEIDVNLSQMEGAQDERWAFQADIYKIVMDACLESGVCKGVGVWGVNDSHSFGMCFTETTCPPKVLPEPLWFDDDFNPKPAYWAFVQSLQEHTK